MRPRFAGKLFPGAAYRLLIVCLAAISACGAFGADPTLSTAHGTAPKPDESARFFEALYLVPLKIVISDESARKLAASPREYVSAKISEGDSPPMEVGIHLKGRNGSFQRLSGKPSLSVKFDKYNPKQRFHGLKKIQLNNSAQDPTYFTEIICDDLFRAAGVPAKRGCHARVHLNGRDLGLYVLNEGFDKTFVKRHFENSEGNLYDTGYRLDIDQHLQAITGHDPNGDKMLRAAVQAANSPVSGRIAALRRTVNLDRFLSFMAMEMITVHWDGYSMFKNNYRVYADPEAQRLEFFPHGMDLMFQKPDCSILPAWDGVIARGLMETDEGKRMYLDRLGYLVTNVFSVQQVQQRIRQLDAVVRPFFLEKSPVKARAHDQIVADLSARI